MKSLKLTALEADALSDKAMSKIMGGIFVITTYQCYCACAYANSGGSSSVDNGTANSAKNLDSPGKVQE